MCSSDLVGGMCPLTCRRRQSGSVGDSRPPDPSGILQWPCSSLERGSTPEAGGRSAPGEGGAATLGLRPRYAGVGGGKSRGCLELGAIGVPGAPRVAFCDEPIGGLVEQGRVGQQRGDAFPRAGQLVFGRRDAPVDNAQPLGRAGVQPSTPTWVSFWAA